MRTGQSELRTQMRTGQSELRTGQSELRTEQSEQSELLAEVRTGQSEQSQLLAEVCTGQNELRTEFCDHEEKLMHFAQKLDTQQLLNLALVGKVSPEFAELHQE